MRPLRVDTTGRYMSALNALSVAVVRRYGGTPLGSAAAIWGAGLRCRWSFARRWVPKQWPPQAAAPLPAPPAVVRPRAGQPSGALARLRPSGPLARVLLPFLLTSDRKDRRTVAAAFAALIGAKCVTITAPILLGRLIDYLALGAASISTPVALSLVSGYAFARIASSGFNEARGAIFARISHAASNKLACQSFARLHKMDSDFLLMSKHGELASILSRGNKSIAVLLNMLVFQVLPTAFEFSLVLGVLALQVGLPIASITAATMVAYVQFTTRVTRRRTEHRAAMIRAEQRAAGALTESLVNNEAVRLFSNEHFELERYRRQQDELQAANVTVAKSLAFLNFGQQTIFNLGLGAALALTALQVAAGAAPVGHLAFVSSLLFQLAIPLNLIGSVYRETKLNLIDLEMLDRLLELQPKCASPPNALPFVLAAPKPGEVEFEHVKFAYRSQKELVRMNDYVRFGRAREAAEGERGAAGAAATSRAAGAAAGAAADAAGARSAAAAASAELIFKDLSFRAAAGARVGIVGPSGCGKSTLAKLLYRFYDPLAGEIRVDGQPLRGLELGSYRRHLGIVPQNVVLFNDTIEFNVRYGNPGASQEDVARAIHMAQLDQLVGRSAEGVRTVVGERGLKLSGGEKQRLGIARCILRDPAIVILDEATSALDSATEAEIVRALDEMSRGRTTFIIAHRLSTLAGCDTILLLADGRVAESGTHATLLANRNGLYAKLWHAQTRAAEEDDRG